MSLKSVHQKAWMLYIAAALVIIAVFFVNPLTEWTLIAFLLVFGALYMTAYRLCLNKYRCPECDQLLRMGIKRPTRCPHCARLITEEDWTNPIN